MIAVAARDFRGAAVMERYGATSAALRYLSGGIYQGEAFKQVVGDQVQFLRRRGLASPT